MKPIRRYLTFSNALASLALFVALGGSAYAVSSNSVGTKELKNRAVTTPKLRNNAVTAHKIRRNAVTTTRLRNQAVTGAKLRNNAVGAAKIRDGAVTGAKIAPDSIDGAKIVASAIDGSKIAAEAIDRSKLNLSALGPLPAAERAESAQQADRAAMAGHAETAGRAEAAGAADSVVGREPFLYRLSVGETQDIANRSSVTVYAECVRAAAGQEVIRVRARTLNSRAVLLMDSGSLPGGPDPEDFLNVETFPANRTLGQTGSHYPLLEKLPGAVVISPFGRGIGIADGDVFFGVNFSSADCIVGGTLSIIG